MYSSNGNGNGNNKNKRKNPPDTAKVVIQTNRGPRGESWFLMQTLAMLNDPANFDAIQWRKRSGGGGQDYLAILNFEKLEGPYGVLTRYFRHCKLSSFTRQLSMYGFTNINVDDESKRRKRRQTSTAAAAALRTYHHPNFSPDGKNAYLMIRTAGRIDKLKSASSTSVHDDDEPNPPPMVTTTAAAASSCNDCVNNNNNTTDHPDDTISDDDDDDDDGLDLVSRSHYMFQRACNNSNYYFVHEYMFPIQFHSWPSFTNISI